MKKNHIVGSLLLFAFLLTTFSGCALVGLGALVSGGESEDPVPSISVSISSEMVTPEPTVTLAPTITEEPTVTVGGSNTPKPTPTTKLAATPTNKPVTPSADSTFSVHFIDVGQADAALVECDGQYMLIDGGNKGDSNVIYSVLKNAGVSKLDIVVGTHAHEDHIGGLPGAYNYCSADLTLCPVKSYDSNAFEDFAKYANQKGGGITIPSVGKTYSLGSATVKILGVNGGKDTNDTSIVLRIDYGKTSFLFTGDAERDAEQAILNRGADLSATVLKVGHHGSDTSTTYPFLREIMPKYAVISVGSGNSYGHPTDDTLSRLRDADVTVYRTDLQSDIYMTSDGKTVTVTTGKQTGAGTSKPTTTKPTAKPSPTPTAEPDSALSTEMVWIPNSGSKYHSRSGCSNMKNPSRVTKDEAISRGFTACKKCY